MSHDAWIELDRKILGQKRRHEYYLKRKAHNMEIVAQYLENGCAQCGEMNKYVLEFHHKDPKTKVRTIKSSYGRSTKLLEEELDKCVVLCITCHRNVHFPQDSDLAKMLNEIRAEKQ